jgi:hypothetical protein
MQENTITSKKPDVYETSGNDGYLEDQPLAGSSKRNPTISFVPIQAKYSKRNTESKAKSVELVTQRLIESDPPLAELFGYYMSQGLPTISKGDLFKLTFSTLIGGLSLILYYDPTREFAGDSSLAIIVFELSVLYANFGVSAFTASESCDTFLNNIPRHLAEKINSEAKKGKKIAILRQASAILFSLISAAPFAFATSGSFIGKLLVEITNAVINYYGINNIMFKNAEWLQRKLTRDQDLRNYYKILDAFERGFNTAIQKAIEDQEIPENLLGENLSPSERFLTLLNEIEKNKIPEVKLLSWPKLIARSLAALTGSVVVLGGLLGYFFKLHENMSNEVSSNHSINIPATLFFCASYSYLAAAFGAKAFANIFDIVTGSYEKSLAMMLYTKITTAAHAATLAMVSLSFATAVYFIDTSPYFNDDGLFSAYKPLFLFLAGASSFVFNQYANQLFAPKIIEAIIRYWGPGQQRALAFFVYEMKSFMDRVRRNVEPSIFLKDMMKLTKQNQQEKILLSTLSYLQMMAEKLDKGKSPELTSESNINPQQESYPYRFFSAAKQRVSACLNVFPGLSGHHQAYQSVVTPRTTSDEETGLNNGAKPERRWGFCNIT